MPVERVYNIIKKDLGKKKKKNENVNIIQKAPSNPIMLDDKNAIFDKVKKILASDNKEGNIDSFETSHIEDILIKLRDAHEDVNKALLIEEGLEKTVHLDRAETTPQKDIDKKTVSYYGYGKGAKKVEDIKKAEDAVKNGADDNVIQYDFGKEKFPAAASRNISEEGENTTIVAGEHFDKMIVENYTKAVADSLNTIESLIGLLDRLKLSKKLTKVKIEDELKDIKVQLKGTLESLKEKDETSLDTQLNEIIQNVGALKLSNTKLKTLINSVIDIVKNMARNLLGQDNDKDINLYHKLVMYTKITDTNKLVDLILDVRKNFKAKMEGMGHKEIVKQLNAVWHSYKNNTEYSKLIPLVASASPPKGYGVGEIYVEFVFPDAESQGGSVSYDIAAGKDHYEVKCYPRTNSAIRLGVEGTLTGFEAYHKLAKVFSSIQNILKLAQEEKEFYNRHATNAEEDSEIETIFEKMCSSSDSLLPKEYQGKNLLPKLNELFASRTGKSLDKSGKFETLADKLNAGEFAVSNIDAVQEVIDIFSLLVNSVYKNSHEYIKLIKQNQIFSVRSMKKNTNGSLTVQTNPPISREFESKLIEAINSLKTALDEANSVAKGEKFLDYFKKSIEKRINEDFNQHPMILMNSNITGQSTEDAKTEPSEEISLNNKNKSKGKVVETADEICFGIYTKFSFQTISQKGVKVSVVS